MQRDREGPDRTEKVKRGKEKSKKKVTTLQNPARQCDDPDSLRLARVTRAVSARRAEDWILLSRSFMSDGNDSELQCSEYAPRWLYKVSLPSVMLVHKLTNYCN